jgi:hypothetical protein
MDAVVGKGLMGINRRAVWGRVEEGAWEIGMGDAEP